MYYNVLCINCENYIELEFIDYHSKTCNRPTIEVLKSKDEIQLKLFKLSQAFKRRNDKYSKRALDLVQQMLQSTNEKELRNCVEETEVLCQLCPRDVLLQRMKMFCNIKEIELQKNVFSNTNSRTRESIQTKEELKKLIRQKQTELNSYRLQNSMIRKKTEESLERLRVQI